MKACRFLSWVQMALGAGAIVLIGCRSSTDEPRAAVTNEYHGVQVVDRFRWLETATNPVVREWTATQNQRARKYLDGLTARAQIEDRLERLLGSTGADYYALCWRRGTLYALKLQPPAQQPVLVTLGSLTNLTSERVILDPYQLNTNRTTRIDWYVPSLDGGRVAVSLSEHGSDLGTLYVYDTATRRPAPDSVPRVHGPATGGSAAWNADGTGLFYTRHPRPGERPDAGLDSFQQVYFHRLGSPPEEDTYEVGKEFPRTAQVTLRASPDGRYLLASVANGGGGECAHYLREPSGLWRAIARFEDQIAQAEFGRDPLYIEWGKDEALYLLSHDRAPNGKILRLPLDQPSLAQAELILAEGTNAIQSFRPAASGMALVYLKGGPSEFAYLDYFDNVVRRVQERGLAAVAELAVTHGDAVLYRMETYTEPCRWMQYDPTRSKTQVEPTAFVGTTPTPFGDLEVVRHQVPSKDGTRVPLNVVRKRGIRLNGENPTLLTGYGGFGISMTPRFDVTRRIWFDQGGVVAIANPRGGGEFGESWHRAGSTTNKQNAFDDFAACAAFLIASNYTSPARLSIEGHGHGALLVIATLTQRPSLVGAVVAQGGMYDLLRAELDSSGLFNTTEFGSVRDLDQFRSLYSWSPYHQVRDQTAYPAVLMMTGENGGRVSPTHSWKMVARLQSATAAQQPVLLRASASVSGHGPGTAGGERLEEMADVYAFLFDRLGIEYSLIDRGPWSGAVTPDTAIIKVKLVREGINARLRVSKNAALTDPLSFGPELSATNQGNVVRFDAAGLAPDTQYYYGVEIEGRLERRKIGAFRTFPTPGPASFTIAFASCARTGSPSEIFDRIRETAPLFFLHTGDFHYLNIATNDRAQFRSAYDAVLASPQQADLYRNIPLVYVWDDHDFGGNNSTRRALSEAAARTTYDEYVPHYPLPLAFHGRETGPIAQSFAVGRVKFIVTELRSDRDEVRKRDTALKTMMGTRQKAWFKKELLAANGKYPLICWVSTVPWIGQAGTNYYRALKTNQYGYIHHALLANAPVVTNQTVIPPAEDHWGLYSTERREIADFIKDNRIHGLCILHGDGHMLGADDGTHSDYATGGGVPIPVLAAAPLDQQASIKGGPYSQGVYRVQEGEGAFGLLTVTDRGTAIDVVFSGRNIKNEEKISLKFTVPAAQPMANR